MRGGFVGQRLSGVGICSPVADLAKARRPNHVSGRVHVRSAVNPSRQWIKRRRTSDRPVPLDFSVCWRRVVVPMFPRLCRYEVRPQSEQPTCSLAHATPTCAVRPRTPSKLSAPRVRLQVRRMRCRLLRVVVGRMSRVREQNTSALPFPRRPSSHHPGDHSLPLLGW